MTSLKARAVTIVVASLLCATVLAQTGPQKLPSIRLNAGIHNIQAEVAQSPDERTRG